MRTATAPPSLLDDHVLFDGWFPVRGPVMEGQYALVEHPDHPWVTVSSGGGPFWVAVTAKTLDLARVLDSSAFDYDKQATLAACMVGGWGDQNVMRAQMDSGGRRYTALLNAEKAIQHLDGRLALLATGKQAAYVQGLLDSRDTPYDLRREAETALGGLLTKTQAADLIPRLSDCPRYQGRPDPDIDYDHWHDTPVPQEDTW